jgi:transcriptional regulator with XRE-family HTH domain
MKQPDFGALVALRRKQAGISQVELARRVGVGRTYLSMIENGHARNPSAALHYRLCKELGIDFDQQERSTPFSLKQFAEQANLPPEDVMMLAGIHYRGRQPVRVEQWRIIYAVIRAVLSDDFEWRE